MPETPLSHALSLGEGADEAAWRALVDKALKGAPWDKLTARTADGIAIKPLYRETDVATAGDQSGFPGAAPFIRGARNGPWLIQQRFDHPDPERTNADILADLAGGANAIELAIDPSGNDGVVIRNARDLDIALAGVILEAAPVSLDAGAHALEAANLLGAKIAGGDRPGLAFNLDPIGVLMRTGAMQHDAIDETAKTAAFLSEAAPDATGIRIDARPVHEAGGTAAQEIAAALSTGIAYLGALTRQLAIDDAARIPAFTVAVGPDVLMEAAKLRALRLCWARIMEASGAAPHLRAARIHAVTSRRMMTRYDPWTNILRVTTAAFAAAIGGADAITTLPFTDALGGPTPFARRIARNTQQVLMEEARLAHVTDPAGGAWFVESMTLDLARTAWAKMQEIEAAGGIVRALSSGALRKQIAEARDARAKAFATRRETITGVTDYPLLDAPLPEFEPRAVNDALNGLAPIRWAAPFEALRDSVERAMDRQRPSIFFATLGSISAFGPRAQFSRNLFAAGGIGSIGAEDAHASIDTLAEAFRASGARVAVLAGADADYAERAAETARALKSAGADWIVLAGKPGANEAAWRASGVDQFVFAGDDAVAALTTLHRALGL